MELKELTDRTLELFGVDNPDNLGSALLDNISKTDKLKFGGGDTSAPFPSMIVIFRGPGVR